ncbi:hypothetical protein [Pantoea vagans]|uniref:hypothetical protein n=1 Tax=Pantoea vagans TaxID=470934 RepID=UPI00320A98DA
MKIRFILPVLSLALGVSLAFASPKHDTPDINAPDEPTPVRRNWEPMLMPPPPGAEPVVYAVTQQTENPNEAVKNIASQLPQISGDKYIVRLEVVYLQQKDSGESNLVKHGSSK